MKFGAQNCTLKNCTLKKKMWMIRTLNYPVKNHLPMVAYVSGRSFEGNDQLSGDLCICARWLIDGFAKMYVYTAVLFYELLLVCNLLTQNI